MAYPIPGGTRGAPLRVAVIGASDDEERYSNKAIRALLAAGHEPVPVHPTLATVLGLPAVREPSAIRGAVDVVSVYLRPELQEPMVDAIVALSPRRIVANPGAECLALAKAARARGIEYLEACTLVLLATGQFEV